MKELTIGIAEQKIAKSPDKLITLGLGSCVGLVLYDEINKVAGMVHIMLPTAPKGTNITNKHKFADTAIIELIRQMLLSGARRNKMSAKLAGGAHMFNLSYKNDVINVGQRNVEMCRKMLHESAIAIASEDTGGTFGRSIAFCCKSNLLQVRTISPNSIRLI